MTEARVIEMTIKPPFKFFVMPTGTLYPNKEYCCNSLSKAKEIGEKIFLETEKRSSIYNVLYVDKDWETRAGWLSYKILTLDSDCTWFKDDTQYVIHTAFLWNYKVRDWNPDLYDMIITGFVSGKLKYDDDWDSIKEYLNLKQNFFMDDFNKQVENACRNVEEKFNDFITANDQLTLTVQKKYPKLEARYAVFDRMVMFYYQDDDGSEKEFQSLQEFEDFLKENEK